MYKHEQDLDLTEMSAGVLTFILLNLLIGIIHLPFLKLIIIILRISRCKFEVGQAKIKSLVGDVQTRLALYCWQWLITFNSSRIRVNSFSPILRSKCTKLMESIFQHHKQ